MVQVMQLVQVVGPAASKMTKSPKEHLLPPFKDLGDHSRGCNHKVR